MSSISTLSFFKFSSIRSKTWAFGMMQFAHKSISGAEGQRFYKLMGTGKGEGFNPFPDWSVYCLLQVWDSKQDAEDFFSHHGIFQRYKSKASKVCTIFLNNIQSKGMWSGKNPFEPNKPNSEINEIAIITRATIRTSKLRTFWSYVPTSQKQLLNNPGLIYTKGIGEVPLLNMATFSIWKDKESMMDFAYKQRHHQKAIKMTKQLDWYKEELFARFQIIKIEGDKFWN